MGGPASGDAGWIREFGRAGVLARLALPETPARMPGVHEVEGAVLGVGFAPHEVRLSVDGRTMTYRATEEQVERAISLRHADVRALGVSTRPARLLGIGPVAESLIPDHAKDEERWLFGKWAGLLERLSK